MGHADIHTMGIHLPTCSDSSCSGCNPAVMHMAQVAVAMPQAATSTGTVRLDPADMRKIVHIFLATVFWFIFCPLFIGQYMDNLYWEHVNDWEKDKGNMLTIVARMIFFLAGGA
jgi:hypothetical protein